MNSQRTLLVVFVSALLMALPIAATAQSQPSFGKRAQWLLRRGDDLHVASPVRDDAWSRKLFDLFLEELDPNGYFLTQQDVQSLSAFQNDLDDQLGTGDEAFLNATLKLYEARVHWADSLCKAELAKPFDFGKPDSYELTWGERYLDRVSGTAALAHRWRQHLRYDVLESVYFMHKDSTDYTPSRIALAMKDESIAREKVSKLTSRKLERKLSDPRTFCGEALLRATAMMFDPHTNYFSPVEEETFSDALSTQALSLGLELEEDDNGEVTIGKLVPGGPAWRSGELHKGDAIISIKGSDGKEHDLTLADADEIQHVLDISGSGAITLTVRKSTGLVTKVTLVKEEMRSEENVVRSLVIQGEHKLGYLSLPGFYTDWEDLDGVEGCANDVAREILKLKKDGVEGIILDLRFNGGGSIKEAADLAGIFIDAGPLWVSRDNDNVRNSRKDANRGAMWEGPLALMVNGGSASASEFIAGTLQDYNRAIVVGSRTFGKATGQITLPLDPVRNSAESGYLKVTTQKFYHLDGRSHQLSGIIPDVELEDPLETWMRSERDYPTALPPDTIVKKTYYTPLPEPSLQSIQEESRKRLAQEPLHRDYVQVVAAINQYREEHTKVNLTPADFFSFREDYDRLTARWDEVSEKKGVKLLTITNNSYDAALYAVDEYAREAQKAMQEHLAQDLYLSECVRVLNASIQH
jgi:carboxyl-terminal processing protease